MPNVEGKVSGVHRGEYGLGFRIAGDETWYNLGRNYTGPENIEKGQQVTFFADQSEKGNWYVKTLSIKDEEHSAEQQENERQEHVSPFMDRETAIARSVALKAAIDMLASHQSFIAASSTVKVNMVVEIAKRFERHLGRHDGSLTSRLEDEDSGDGPFE